MAIGFFPLKVSWGTVADLFDFTASDPDCSAINQAMWLLMFVWENLNYLSGKYLLKNINDW